MTANVINFEQMDFRMFRRLSDCLNISFSELIDITPTLTPVFVFKNFVSGYTLSVGQNAPAIIAKKIKGLSLQNTIYLHYYQVFNTLANLEMKN